jgi:hypothetical protein
MDAFSAAIGFEAVQTMKNQFAYDVDSRPRRTAATGVVTRAARAIRGLAARIH